MPNTCRTDTFISGNPVISCALVVAAVVINPPRSRAFPKPDLRHGCGCGLEISLAESFGRQKSAIRSKFRCLFIEIGMARVFGKAALRIAPHFAVGQRPFGALASSQWHFSVPSPLMLVRARSGKVGTGFSEKITLEQRDELRDAISLSRVMSSETGMLWPPSSTPSLRSSRQTPGLPI